MAAAGAKHCTKCGRLKPLGAFWADARTPDGKRSACKVCGGITRAERDRRPEVRARERERQARPQRLERRRAGYRRRRAALLARHRAYQGTPLGRLLHNRRSARYRLRRAADPARAARIAATVALYDAEIARLRAKLAEED